MHNGEELTAAVDRLVAAVDVRDAESFHHAFERIVQVGPGAPPTALQDAIVRLLPVLEKIGFGVGSNLAQAIGALAGEAVDATVVLPVLVRRGIDVSRKALLFAEAYQGELPDSQDMDLVEPTQEAFDGPGDLIEAWFTAGDWLQPVLYLMQRKEIRRALPERDAFTTAVAAVKEHFEVAEWLCGLLRVLDDTRLIVLHRETGRGFQVTISGIGDNFQLHTLLAANLIGSRWRGRLPGTRPTKAMIAAATDGEIMPPGGLVGQFNLVDGYGKWIWNEGRPHDIPAFEGELVVVLDPPPYQRGWNAGRAYPLMRPTVTVDRTLSSSEARLWLARIHKGT
jgi:hypothetical protein